MKQIYKIVNNGITVEIDGIIYKINKENNIEISNLSNKQINKISIPDTIQIYNFEFNVSIISNTAISGCTQLTSITIPLSIIKLCHNTLKRL